MVNIIYDSSCHDSLDLLDLSDPDIHTPSPFTSTLPPLPIDDLSNIKHVSPDHVDTLPSVVDSPNETEFLPNLTSNTSPNNNNNTTFLLDWLHQQYPSIANHFHQHIQSIERLPYDDSIRVTGTNNPSTPISSTPDFLTENLHISSTSNDVSTLYNELSEDNKQALLTQALLTNNTALIHRLLMLTSKNTSVSLANLSEKLLTHEDKHKVPELRYDVQANKRRLLYHNWFTRLLPIIKMFPQTSPIYHDNTIIPFNEPSCIGNQALFLLISAKVDNFYRNLI